MNNPRNIFFAFFLFISSLLFSQKNQNTLELPLKGIFNIIEDDFGFIWISTDHGLKRYDGEALKNILFDDKIDDSFVRITFLKKEKTLLCNSYFGQPILVSTATTLSEPPNYKVLEERKRKAFYATISVTKTSKFFQFFGTKKDTLIEFRDGKYTKEVIKDPNRYFLYKEGKREYYFAGVSSLIKKVDDKIDTLYKFVSGECFIPKIINCEINQEIIFFDTGKLISVDFNTDKVTVLATLTEINRLDINQLDVDPNRNKWLFTKKGALLIKADGKTDWLLKGEDVNSGFEDNSKTWYWLSTQNGGIHKVPVVEQTNIEELNFNVDFISASRQGLFLVSNNILYLKNNETISELFNYNGTELEDQPVQKIIQGKNEIFIFARNRLMTLSKAAFKYAPSNAAFNIVDGRRKGNFYYCIEAFSIKDFIQYDDEYCYLAVWDGIFRLSCSNGLYKFNRLPNIITGTIKNINISGEKLYYTNNTDVFETNLNNGGSAKLVSFNSEIKRLLILPNCLLAGFNNKGLAIYKNNKVLNYTTKNSDLLSDEIINLVYANNKIWVNTTEGIQQLEIRENEVHFYKPFFLKSKENIFSIKDSLCYVIKKEIANQICIFNSNAINENNKSLLYIDVLKNNGKFDPEKGNVLPYKDNYLNIQLGTLNYQGLKNKYFYQLNSDNDSSDFKKSEGNGIDLRSIESGKYKLSFYCTNSNGVRSNIVSYSFIVAKPFWDEIWFFILVGSGLAGTTAFFIITYYRKKQKRNKERHENEYKILQLEQQLFKSLMNPHFIFNSLNSIQSLINSNKQKEASANINLFSLLVRKNLEDSIEGFCTLEEELIRLKLYIEMENLRFNNCINFFISNDERIDTNSVRIPAFIMQPLAENSILHGVLPKGSGIIEVKINREGSCSLKIQISDDGIGLNAGLEKKTIGEKKSLAIGLISSRLNKLEKIHSKPYKFDISDRMEIDGLKGTVCTLILPL